MNLIEKIISYFRLRAKGVSHKSAVKQFAVNPLTYEDGVMVGWAIVVAILVALMLYAEHQKAEIEIVQNQQRIAEHKRQLAEHKAIKHEQIVLAMLNGGRIKIDGVTRSVCVKDTNGDCL